MRGRDSGNGLRSCWNLRRFPLAVFLVTAIGLLVAPTTAFASFHEILVREVYAGGAGSDSYVVLQAYNSGQNFVGGHSIAAYDQGGSQIGSFTFPSAVANGQNQMTILVADTAYATSFPSGPTPDGTAANLDLSPAGGAVCWAGLDCVAWGAFSGTTTPTSGSPASPGGITAGMALRRTIAAGNCVNRLDLGDDSNDSAADFTLQAPHPRNNASTIEEASTCVAPQLPSAVIDSGPSDPTKSTAAAFTYHSDSVGAEFECSLDSSVTFAGCEGAGIGYPGPLSEGTHTFRVRAKDGNGTGNADSHTWRIDLTAPTVTIDKAPANPSSGVSASFDFHASETVPGFQCSLAKDAAPDAFSACSSGQTYTSLSDGTYTFKVYATDPAGNEGSPSAHVWEVDNSLADTTPPETAISSAPTDPSESSLASFGYASNEPGSSFECSLDGATFATCAATGITYGGLTDGPHSFQVRARDGAGNIDDTPAGFSWAVALPALALPVAQPLPSRPSAAPQTTIAARPAATTHDRTPSLRFRSNQPGASFQCRVDHRRFKPCRSPFTTPPLSFGRHTISVRAVVGTVVDATPAQVRLTVVPNRR